MSDTSREQAIALEVKPSILMQLIDTSLRDTKLYGSTQSDQVRLEIASFIATHIDLLPTSLTIAINLAMKAFNVESVLYHGKTFARSSQQSQSIHLKRWEKSRFAAKRDFIRFIRSLALFNYYDHPDVRSRI